MPDTALGTWDTIVKRKGREATEDNIFVGETGQTKTKAHKVRWSGGLENKEMVCFELSPCRPELKNET